MPKMSPAYAPEFRVQIVVLGRAVRYDRVIILQLARQWSSVR